MGKLLDRCPACSEVEKGAKPCPNCGKDVRGFFRKHKILTVLLVFAVLGTSGILGAGVASTTNPSTSTVSTGPLTAI